jgi:chemotaxis signal transduction protein
MEKTDKDQGLLLEKRARNLAQPSLQLEPRESGTSLLVFKMMGRRYAVELSCVVTVTRIQEIISIPSAPRHIPGIIRRRGESIGLANLSYFFNAAKPGISDADFAIIVQVQGKKFALQVEDIVGATTVRNADLLSPQDNFDPVQLPFVWKVMLNGLVILSLDALVRAKGFAAEKSV